MRLSLNYFLRAWWRSGYSTATVRIGCVGFKSRRRHSSRDLSLVDGVDGRWFSPVSSTLCAYMCMACGVCCVHVYYQRCFWLKYHSKEWPPKEISSLSTTFSAKAHPSKLTCYFPGCVIKVPWYYWCSSSSHWRPMREGTERPLCTTSAVEKVGKIWVTLWQMCFDWLSSLAHTHTNWLHLYVLRL